MTLPRGGVRHTVRRPPGSNDWAQSYANRLLVTDAVVIVWAVFGSQIAWFGLTEQAISVSGRFSAFGLTYTVLSSGLSVAWLIVLSATGSRDGRVVGIGTAEYVRIIRASVTLFGGLAVLSYLTKAELARGYFFTALPLGVAVLLMTRWMWRQYLVSKRAAGEFSAQVVLVGSCEATAVIAGDLVHMPAAGYRVRGAFLSNCIDCTTVADTSIPVLGTIDELDALLPGTGADTVIITSSEGLPPERMRQLSWSLEPGRQHLVVAPGLVDVAGPRIHTRPVAGLPLIHVETPRYEGGGQAVKRIFDVVVSLTLIVLLSPVFLVIAGLIKISSSGMVFYRSQRVGYQGEAFGMFKFRSMRVGADAELAELLVAQGTHDTPLFKITDDPRITPVGRVLRRYSLDELPQLFNVLMGTMSLVGPRPQVADEVALYDESAHRRLLLKPGITGLWQVSGRSNLDWDATVRLDLYYVENWGLASDLIILWRTVRAVLAREGAY
jgi:exopolysaccharide biosynthesis polyprenyl glycosylphosphotransferase